MALQLVVLSVFVSQEAAPWRIWVQRNARRVVEREAEETVVKGERISLPSVAASHSQTGVKDVSDVSNPISSWLRLAKSIPCNSWPLLPSASACHRRIFQNLAGYGQTVIDPVTHPL